jgi:hypothetical protein
MPEDILTDDTARPEEGDYRPTCEYFNGSLKVTSHYHLVHNRQFFSGPIVFLQEKEKWRYVGFEVPSLQSWWERREFQKNASLSMILERIRDFGETEAITKAMINNFALPFVQQHGLNKTIEIY